MKLSLALLLAVVCLGIGMVLGHWLIPDSSTGEGEATTAEARADTSMTLERAGAKEQKPLAEDIPQAGSARDLLNTIKSANRARSQAQMYLAVERLSVDQLAALAGEAEVLARRDWRAWDVQSAILSRWTEIAPLEALAYSKNLKGSSRRNAIGAVFAQLASTNPGLAERHLTSFSQRSLQRQALRALAAGLADSSPQQGISMLEKHGAPASDYAFHEIAGKWARRDPGGASSYAEGLPPGRKRDRMVHGVAHAWASTDPDGALNWARALGDRRLRKEAVSTVIGSIAAEDPLEALALVEKEPRHDQHGLRQRALGEWFQSDHEAAMEWINDRPNQAERLRLFYGSAYRLVWEDPEHAYELVKDLPAGEQKINFMGRILSHWSWNDPESGLDWLKSFPSDMQGRLLGRGSHWGLAEGDPEAFREILEGVTITDRNKRAFQTLGSHYVDEDPDKALEWAQTIESSSARADVVKSLYGSWAYREPEAAAEKALALEDADQRKGALESIANSWARNDPERAMEWAEGLSGSARDSALGAVIRATAAEDPVKASTEVERLLADGSGDRSVAETAAAVASTWTESDPSKAAQWAGDLGDDLARKEAVGKVAGRWAQFDPVGASEWIGALPESPERDAAAGELAQRIRGTDPERAFAWASTIADERDRFKVMEDTISSWKESNESAAREAVLGSDLSPSDQEKLLEGLGSESSSTSSTPSVIFQAVH